MTTRTLDEIEIDPDCGQRHIGRCGGVSFRSRLLSVQIPPSVTPTRERVAYYDDEQLAKQTFDGKNRHERRAELEELSKGLGYAKTDPATGELYRHDMKSQEYVKVTDKELSDVYLAGDKQVDL